MNNPSAVRIDGPLSTYLNGFSEELGGRGYKPVSATRHLRLLAHLSRWLEAEGLVAEDLTPVRLEEFLRARRAAGFTYRLSPHALVPLIGYLTGLGVVSPVPPTVPTPCDVLIGDYRRHLVADRGLASSTVATYIGVARDVLEHCGNPQGRELAGVSAGEMCALTLAECRQRSVPSAKAFVTALRSWLRFLSAEGVTSHDLAGAVPTVAGWRDSWVPRGLSEAEVAALLHSVDATTAVGLRDRAVLVLLVRLALRVGEVARLVLDDIDWRRGEILIRGKGNRHDRLPVPADVGEALVAYLRDGRSLVSCRAVFLRAHAPITPLSAGAVGLMVRRVAKRAGVAASAHKLRHTAATAMLRAGGSLDEVGQVLHHGSVDTTAIYAKVDHLALRELAGPWPGRAA
jgi:site-specific recombinase XerD